MLTLGKNALASGRHGCPISAQELLEFLSCAAQKQMTKDTRVKNGGSQHLTEKR